VVLPFLGGLYAGDQGFFPDYVYGEHHFPAVRTMIITSGLGSDREKLPRFNNPPEVVRIVLE
jgi:predicted MPP superfamily phosphohydrolase